MHSQPNHAVTAVTAHLYAYKNFILLRGLKFLHFLSCSVSHWVAQSLKYQRIKLVKSLIFVNFVYGNQAFPPPSMSQYCIYIALDPYLAQWFVHDCGGEVPCILQKGSVESKVLEVYLQRLPHSVQPQLEAGTGEIAIAIPAFRHRPAETYNYLPKRATSALLNCIRNRFDVALWNDLHHFGKIGRRQDELIYAWMEKHGIEPTEANWNAIAKRYQRQRDLYLDRQRKSSKKSQKSY